MTVYLDFETRSEVDIRKVGAWAYAEHPSTQIICLAYSLGEGVELIKEPYRAMSYKPISLLESFAAQSSVNFEAHNAFFEQAIWHNIMHKRLKWPDIPIERWRCSAAKASAHALPRSLEGCGSALNLDTQKSQQGKAVMLRLSKPRRPSKKNPDKFWEPSVVPDQFNELYEYCRTDVAAEVAISCKLRDLNETEQKIWFLDQKINRRGVAVDTKTIDIILKLMDEYNEALNKEVQDISKGVLSSVSKRDRVLQFCLSKGVFMESYDKAYVSKMLDSDLPDEVRRILEIRQSQSKTSTAKYKSMRTAVCKDSRIRDTLMYHGASTGRWTGKLVQFQNIPRGQVKDIDQAISLIKEGNLSLIKEKYGDPMEVFSSCLRSMLMAEEGCRLIAADFASIEVRVLMWLANAIGGLKQLREGEDLYVDMAKEIYKKSDIKKEERQLGKTAILGCGYGMGSKRFHTTCSDWGIPIDSELADLAVDAYRSKYSAIVKFWYQIETAAIQAVKSNKPVNCGRLLWATYEEFLFCKLPGGRCLAYYSPKLTQTSTPWGTARDELTFMGVNSITRKWERQSTYGGKLTENVTQAVARDLMAESMLRLEEAGYPIVLSVHDELVAEVPEGYGSVAEFETLMANVPDWARGCPIEAEGWEGKRYRK